MSDVTYEQTLALAGICKASYCAQQLARNGTIDNELLHNVLSWSTETDPKHPLDVFGDEKNVERGYQIIHDQLGHKSHPKEAEITRYTLGLMVIERRLMSNKTALQKLAKGIEDVKRQQDHFELTDMQIVSNLASLYKDIISPLGSRIQILGNPNHLKNKDVQHKIRAVLLSGLRAAVLWRQLGGKRRNILFRRRKWVAFSTQALNKIPNR